MSDFNRGFEAGQRAAMLGEGCSFYMAPATDYERGYMRGWLWERMLTAHCKAS